jgi:hypothetical protein
MDRTKRFRSLALHPRKSPRLRALARRRNSARPWSNQWPRQGNRVAKAGLWQKGGVIALFVLMASVGFGAYAGYGRMVCTAEGQAIERHPRHLLPPAAWVHSFPPAPTEPMQDEMGAWLAKASDLTAVAAIVVFGNVASAVASAL